MRRLASRAAVGALIAILAVGASLVVRRAIGSAQAEDFAVTGTILSPQSDGGGVAIDDGASVYPLLTLIDPQPFIGKEVTLKGSVVGGTLFARELVMGSIQIEVQGTAAHLLTSGIIEQSADGFETTAEGIMFTLTKSDKLGEVVGQRADIEGDLTEGTVVMLTRLVTADGQEIETQPFGNEFSDTPDSGIELDASHEDDG